VDPLGGSYFIEQLTDELEAKAWEYVRQIDAKGGAVRAIEQQFYQTEIAASAYRYQQSIEKKETVIVGVNEFISEEDSKQPLFSIDESAQEIQLGRLQALRKRRESAKVKSSLEELKRIAAGKENVVPAILACVEAYATLGEISDSLREIWGEYA